MFGIDIEYNKNIQKEKIMDNGIVLQDNLLDFVVSSGVHPMGEGQQMIMRKYCRL